MAFPPTYVFEVDWANTDTWIDETSRLLGVKAFRGRNSPSQISGRADPGRLVAKLDNVDGRFSKFNAAGAVYGNIKPNRRCRLRITDPVDITRWQGQLYDIAPGFDVIPTAALEAHGPLDWLARATISPPGSAGDDTGDILTIILDAAAWSATARDLDTGQSTTSRWFVDGGNALEAARQIEDTEAGFLYESADGKIVFRDRHYRLTGARLTSQATYSDEIGADFPYDVDSQQSDSIRDIYNRCEVTIYGYTIAALATLWTCSETTLTLGAGQTRTFTAQFTNVAVAAWTTPVVGTDVTQSGGVNGNLAVVATKYATRMTFALTNNGGSTMTLTLISARGTAVVQSNPTIIVNEDLASQDDYGIINYPFPGRWISSINDAEDFADFVVAVYAQGLPYMHLAFTVSTDEDLFTELMTRDISDRITAVATGLIMPLGLSGEFFVENILDVIDFEPVYLHRVEMDVGFAINGAAYWAVGSSELGTETILGF